MSDPVPGESGGRRFLKFTVESEPGILIPCATLLPEGSPASVVIAAHPEGKDAALRHPAAQQALRDGKALCLADLRTFGETRWAHVDDQIDLFTARAVIWLGRTMLGDWVKDLLAVRAAVVQLAGPKTVELLAFGATVHPNSKNPAALSRGAMFALGDTTLAALAAAAIDRRFAGVTVENLLSTHVPEAAPSAFRYGIFVPGMLKWGDVSLLAALARCPVRVNSLVSLSGRALTSAESAAWLAEVRRLGVRMKTPASVLLRKG